MSDNDNETTDSMESLDEVSQDIAHLCEDMDGLTEMTDIEDLPSAIIVASVDISIFEDEESRDVFEQIFSDLDMHVTFIYLKNFRRVRVEFTSSECAAVARIRYDGVSVCGSIIRCYFVKVQLSDQACSTLHPPKPTRMFLISPPASPPVGWEPVPESEPVINLELIAAISKLKPGGSHELHPPTIEHPGIVVHLCEDNTVQADLNRIPKKMLQTKMPPRTTSS